MPEELWTEVHNIVQEMVIKTISKKNKCKKAKWLSEEAFQIAVKEREAKSKGQKERYKHLNAEFQRVARRDKKAFLSYQCKEKEENNRMGKTRDLFKEIRDTKGTFLAKMGSIKDRNGMDLTEAEEIKKRWQEYTEDPGEGNGNTFQYSCLKNPMDRGAWWATIHWVTKSQTRLSMSMESIVLVSAFNSVFSLTFWCLE